MWSCVKHVQQYLCPAECLLTHQALRVSPIVYIPASINYHKRGVKTYEPVSNIAGVGEKRAPPPHQLITTKGVWKRMNQLVGLKHIAEEIWVGEKRAPPQLLRLGAQVHVRALTMISTWTRTWSPPTWKYEFLEKFSIFWPETWNISLLIRILFIQFTILKF